MDDHSYDVNQPDGDSKYKEFLEMTRAQLVNYLSARGQHVSGGKMSLAARAFIAWENQTPVIMSTEKHQENLQQEYDNMLRNHGIPDPTQLPADQWSKNAISKWPLVDLGKIFSYILRSKSQQEYDGASNYIEYIGKYKSQKAYSYFTSNFVGPLLWTSLPHKEDFCLITGEVTPSQSVRGERHKPWLYIKNTGEVQAAWCTCTGGPSRVCNHVVACLYKIDYAITNHLNTPSCTDKGCGWNAATLKSVQPCRVEDLDLRVDRAGSSSECSVRNRAQERCAKKEFDPRRESERVKTQEQVGEFMNGLMTISPKSVIFTGMAGQLKLKSKSASIPQTIPQIANSCCEHFKDNCGESEKVKFFHERMALSFSTQECALLEEKTRGQSNSALWIEQRKGRITASSVHRVTHKVEEIMKNKKKKAVVTPLIHSLLNGGENLSSVPAIQWGNANEKTAISEFQAKLSPHHQNLTVLPAGLFVMQHKPYIGASPDGIVMCDCHGKSVLEVKSPYSIKDLSVKEHFRKTDFLQEDSGTVILKSTHTYFSQVQCEMAVTGVEHCYLCVSTGNGDPLVISVSRDEHMWAAVETKIDLFFKTYLSQYLLGLKNLSYCPLCSKVILESIECDKDEQRSVRCIVCGLGFHWKCQGYNGMTDFVCTFCSDTE